MMRKVWIISRKEIVDNLRDKRSMFFALVYGALLMPALMLGPLIYATQDQFSPGYETPTTIYVLGDAHAPNLMQRLHQRNFDVEPAPEDYTEQLIAGDIDIVLEIADTYAESFRAGEPARITLHYNQEEGSSQNLFWRIRGELDGYGRNLAAQRMVVRGYDHRALQPFDLVENNLSREEVGAGIIANLLMFLIVMSMTMGGFYLAVDATAGERERLSLEPLLSLAVTRFQVALGKYLAILTFVLLAFIAPIISAGILIQFIPEAFFGSADTPGLATFLKLMLLNLPICLLITGFLMAIAAYAKSIKEAQTQLGFAMLVPMAPFFIVQFMDTQLDDTTQFIPILSQYLLSNNLIMDSGFALSTALPSAVATLALAGAFFLAAVQLYRQDSILG